MTIVIDTEDINGIEDAYKMVRIIYMKYAGITRHQNQCSFGKIEFIKMLRKFGKEAVTNYQTDESFELDAIASLRYTKYFADNVWRDKNE